MSFRGRAWWLVLLFAAAAGPLSAAQYGCAAGSAGQVLTCGGHGLASWVDPPSTLPWSSITLRPNTLAGYGITDARGLSETSSIIFGRDTDVLAANDSYTIPWPAASSFVAVTCDVATAPVGAAIGIDVRAGSPLTSIYTSGHALSIPAGATSTLSGATPILVTSPTPISARQPVQIIVTGVGLSEPGKGLRCTIQEALPCC